MLAVEYFHVVFTLPEQIAELTFYNQDVMYSILFRAASQTLLTIGASPQHLGAQLGFFAILHTWGQNLLFHPHLHVVVPGGGLSADYERFVPCRLTYVHSRVSGQSFLPFAADFRPFTTRLLAPYPLHATPSSPLTGIQTP